MQKGLTFQLVKMGESQTKVKLRFSDVYYPGEKLKPITSSSGRQWTSEIFVDQNIEGTVEGRRVKPHRSSRVPSPPLRSKLRRSSWGPSRPAELPRQALTEPYVRLSPHTALHVPCKIPSLHKLLRFLPLLVDL